MPLRFLNNRLAFRATSIAHFARGPVAVFDGEPVGVAFAGFEIGVAVVVVVAQFVDQDIVEIKILDRCFGPGESPQVAVGRPDAAVHFGFDALLRCGRADVGFFQRLIDGVQINRHAPLHAVTGKEAAFACHAAELHDFQSFGQFLWQQF